MPENESTAVSALAHQLRAILAPLYAAKDDPDAIRRLFLDVGWNLDVVTGLPISQVSAAIGSFSDAYDEVAQYVVSPPDTLGEVVDAVAALGGMLDALRDIPSIAPPAGRPAELDRVAADLLEHLAVTYLEREHPLVWHLAALLTLADPATRAPVTGAVVLPSGAVARHPQQRARLRLERLNDLVTDPIAALRFEYIGPGGLATTTDVGEFADRIFPELEMLLLLTGADVVAGFSSSPDYDLGTVGNDLARSTLSFSYPVGPEVRIGTSVSLTPQAPPNVGVVVRPFGAVRLERLFGTWFAGATISAGLPAFAIGKGGLTIDIGAASIAVSALLAKLSHRGQPAVRVGGRTSTRLEIGSIRISGDLAASTSVQRYGAEVEISGAKVIVAPGDGDGFLKKVLPPDGLRTDFDLAIGWSNTKGLYFRGGAGLEVTLPVHASILGIITVDAVYLALKADLQKQALTAAVAATAGLKLGPIVASVEQMGIEAAVDFPQNGGNLGPANLSQFGFKPPKGAGLSIGAGPVSGGGYLFFDTEKGQYAGVLQVSFKAISLTAVGLLTTKMPDGSEGFSLLVIITAEFPPIQLSFGFTLNGAGGLLGVHRTAMVEVLRAGIKNRTLDSILFPKDPVRNAPQIVSNLSAVFPPVANRYVFGPMAIIGWGTPTLLKIEIGVVLELPSPVRLIIMGRLTLVLPEERAALVILKMDVLGIIDFDKGDASVDATIYDSRIGYWNITGDMAMRANWAAAPTFALAAGGFNPRFTPPPNFPALQRITIALATGDNPRVRLEAYLALTSNTVQLGAQLDIYASVDLGKIIGKWSAQAYLGFDTLMRFSPFEFIADMRAGVALLRNGQPKFSADLFVTLTGPEPWHAWGYVEFDFFGKRQIPFEVRFGAEPPPQQLPTANPRPLLADALKAPGNWSAQLPAGGDGLVTLGPTTLQGVLAHPFGRLTVRQTVVPLGVEIAKFGNAIPSERRFDLTVEINGQQPTPKPEDVREYFAPAQFFELNDDEKLARPSFEPLKAGLSFGVAGIVHPDGKKVEFAYEDRVVDEEDKITLRPLEAYVLAQDVMNHLTVASAAGLVARAETGAAQYAGAKLGISVIGKTYTLADTDTLAAAGGAARSYTEALQVKTQQAATNPAGASKVQVVEAQEAVVA